MTLDSLVFCMCSWLQKIFTYGMVTNLCVFIFQTSLWAPDSYICTLNFSTRMFLGMSTYVQTNLSSFLPNPFEPYPSSGTLLFSPSEHNSQPLYLANAYFLFHFYINVTVLKGPSFTLLTRLPYSTLHLPSEHTWPLTITYPFVLFTFHSAISLTLL